MKSLPEHVAPYNRTRDFSSETAPASLTRDHATKVGVWGVIKVIAGTVEYVIPGEGERHTLSPGNSGIVEPQIPHYVTPAPDAVFFVEFYR